MSRESFSIFGRMGKCCWRVAPKVGVGLLVLLALVAIPWTYFNIKWGRELEAKLAELKAQGMPLTLAEAAPKPVPANQNAARLYQRVFQVDFDSGGFEGKMGGLSQRELGLMQEYLKTPSSIRLQWQAERLLGRRGVNDTLDVLRRASQRPQSIFAVRWDQGAASLLPHYARFRSASYLVCANSLLVARDGRIGEALQWCRVSLRMSEHVASEPTLIAQLVAIAIQAITFDAVEQILSERQLDPATANEFAEYLSRIDLKKDFTTGMIGERALGIQCLEELSLSQEAEGWEGLPVLPAYRARVAWPLWKLDQLTHIDYMSRVVTAHRLPYSDAVAGIQSANKELEALPFYQGVIAKMFIPVFARVVDKRAQATVNIGMCRMALALKAYKYEHGAYPETLDQLEQTLDWQLPEDPFSGEDFVYQRQGEGFKLYSIGLDLKDSDGQPREPVGPGDKPQLDFDIVWECSR